jgi:hypothetical protein
MLWLLAATRVYAQAEFMDGTGELADGISTHSTMVKLFGLALAGSLLWLAIEKSMRALASCFIVVLAGAGWRYAPDIMSSIMGQ